MELDSEFTEKSQNCEIYTQNSKKNTEVWEVISEFHENKS